VGGDGAWRNRLHALEISCHNCELACLAPLERPPPTPSRNNSLNAGNLDPARMSGQIRARLGSA